ncbi:MAG: AAA family ATPase [Haliscomenobacter sp.]
MKLIASIFDNFRCFKEYSLVYGKEATVIIGKNGTGKSSILSAIRRGLSFMFARPQEFPKNLSSNATVRTFEKGEANFDPIHRVFNYPIENSFKAKFGAEVLEWSMLKNSQNGVYSKNLYKHALAKILGAYNEDLKTRLPVFSVLTDSFPHQMMNFGTKVKKTIGQDVLPRDLAYYGWDERTNCIELWLNRFYKVSNFETDRFDEIRAAKSQIKIQERRLEETDEKDSHRLGQIREAIARGRERLQYLQSDKRIAVFTNERNYIANKLLDFTKPLAQAYPFVNKEFEISNVPVRRPDKKTYVLEFEFADGRVIPFDALPMGYKRVFGMVLDIAYRSFILNEDIESEGIVLIDEIEMHLHPTLQQEILQRFKRTFPQIQFIVTTHSPLVISNFKADGDNIIIKLEQDGNKYWNENVENVYGIDYATNLTEVMEAAPRASTIDKYINAYLFLYGRKQNGRAEDMLQKLREYIGGEIPKKLQEEINFKKRAYQ